MFTCSSAELHMVSGTGVLFLWLIWAWVSSFWMAPQMFLFLARAYSWRSWDFPWPDEICNSNTELLDYFRDDSFRRHTKKKKNLEGKESVGDPNYDTWVKSAYCSEYEGAADLLQALAEWSTSSLFSLSRSSSTDQISEIYPKLWSLVEMQQTEGLNSLLGNGKTAHWRSVRFLIPPSQPRLFGHCSRRGLVMTSCSSTITRLHQSSCPFVLLYTVT